MTLKEIAERAGVSIATVSYVLNGSAQISEETRQKVEKIIKETGYRSNMLAKSLRTNKTSLVGVLVEDVTVWHTAYIIDGINKLAEEKGYHTILSNLRLLSKIESQFDHISVFKDDINKALDVLLGMQVDGIIYVGMHDRDVGDVLKDISKPVVYSYCYTSNEGSSVRYSNKEPSYQMTKIFLEHGHRDFAVLKGNEQSEPTHLRMQGIEKALREAGIVLKQENVIEGNWDYHKARKAVRPLFEKTQIPTAVIAMNDDMALAVKDEAFAHNLRVPEDISVAGFDNADITYYGSPKIYTIDRPLQEMGYKAMEILLGKINESVQEDVNIVLPCKIIEGTSIRQLE